MLHTGSENEVVHEGPCFGIVEIDLRLILPEFDPGIFADQFVHLDEGSSLQAVNSRAGSADVHLGLLKAAVSVEFGQTFIEPGGQPSEIGVQQGVHVLVVDDIVFAGDVLIETNDGILSLPAVLKQAAGLRTRRLPESRGHRFHGGFIARGEDDEGRSGLEAHLGEGDGKDGAHLLKFASDPTAIRSAAVGQDAKIGTAHFGPGLFTGVHEGRRHACEQQDEHTEQAKIGHAVLSLGGEMIAGRLSTWRYKNNSTLR